MRKNSDRVNRYRVRTGLYKTDDSFGNTGAFFIPRVAGKKRVEFKVLASEGGGWDHVSVSLPDRCPTWGEMCFIKHLFFRDDEWAMQLHPPIDENISYHPNCLHLWRPQTAEERALVEDVGTEFPTCGPIPIPPAIFVAPPQEVGK